MCGVVGLQSWREGCCGGKRAWLLFFGRYNKSTECGATVSELGLELP